MASDFSESDANGGYYCNDTSEFDGYGDETADLFDNSGTAVPSYQHVGVGYAGQWGSYTDPETGLLSLGHRYYDPGTGRFVSRDPIGYAGGDNLYAYAGNNPVNEADPDGTNPAGSYTTFGGYLGEVGQVLEGEASVFNLVAQYKSVKALYGVARTRGVKVAGQAALKGAEHSYTALWTTNDDREFGESVGTWGVTAFAVGSGGIGISKALGGGITNAVPGTLARVVASRYAASPTLGAANAQDVFVTAASDLKGLNTPAAVAKRLAIDPETSYKVITFSTKQARGLASPIRRAYPKFVGRGRTMGGAREFVIQNGPIPDGAKITTIGP